MFMLTVVNVYTILTGLMGQVLNVHGDSGECLYHPDWFGGAGGECLC